MNRTVSNTVSVIVEVSADGLGTNLKNQVQLRCEDFAEACYRRIFYDITAWQEGDRSLLAHIPGARIKNTELASFQKKRWWSIPCE